MAWIDEHFEGEIAIDRVDKGIFVHKIIYFF